MSKTPTRSFQSFRLASAVTSLALVAACTHGSTSKSVAQVESWIPSAAMRSATASLDSLPRTDEKRGSFEQRPSVVLAALIGTPQDSQVGTWIEWLPLHGTTIKQDLLLKGSDGGFYSASFVWSDDPILVDCVQFPAQCAKFANQHRVGQEEAKEILSHSGQGASALMLKFFGSTLAREAHT